MVRLMFIVSIVHTKTVDNVEGALWLTTNSEYPLLLTFEELVQDLYPKILYLKPSFFICSLSVGV